ncbi:MAG: 3-deoxy-7-phosphoheptulonate synthase [Proteobacteria bacterium]|nr:MAG: 3-deoxy-7-phosphoheptulonate synthase [Pseudomonadota bacterium]
MTMTNTDNIDPLQNTNIDTVLPLPSPQTIRDEIPLSPVARETVAKGRREIIEIIERRDARLLVVLGPCSIHDLSAGLEYAERLQTLSRKLDARLALVMRIYFEKPRTTVGWKGFINDPHLDDSFEVEVGIREARRFLIQIAELGIAAGTEALDPIIPQYLGDLFSWYAIGARTTESQTHREMASGLSAPCGFKNATDGNIDIAINAIKSANQPHHFLGITEQGNTAVIRTRGNSHGHLILRGGSRPNYDVASIDDAVQRLAASDLPCSIMVDCSHGNSDKDPARQAVVARACVAQRSAGQRALIGLMIESHLNWGNQPLSANRDELKYGVSITDACIDWQTTLDLLQELHEESPR